METEGGSQLFETAEKGGVMKNGPLKEGGSCKYVSVIPSAPITTGVVSIFIFHLLVLSVHIIRLPSLFLGRTDHER